MRCAGDDRSAALDHAVAADRAAELARRPNAAAKPDSPPVYVIGTEVPPPGGAQAGRSPDLQVTEPARAETIETYRAARSWPAAWSRPGSGASAWWCSRASSSATRSVRTSPVAARRPTACRRAIETQPGLVYEAHSTDYQTPRRPAATGGGPLRHPQGGAWADVCLARGGLRPGRRWRIVSAGAEDETLSRLPDVIDEVMVADPRYWQAYYRGAAGRQRLRHYSLSDRIRYYWPHPDVQAAQARLMRNLRENPPPLPLLSQFLPGEYRLVREGVLRNEPLELVWAHIDVVLGDYAEACRTVLRDPSEQGA